MERNEFNKEVHALLDTLQEHEATIKKLNDNLQAMLRSNADVSFTSMEMAKEAGETFKSAKDATDKIKKLLKTRAAERMKEI